MEVAKHWRLKGARYRMEGQRNTTTGEIRFPAQPCISAEETTAWQPYVLSGRGEVWSFTVLRQVPDGFEHAAPYPVALVRLDEGLLITAQLTDCVEADLTIGMPVEMVTRRLMDTGPDGMLIYGYKFRPVLQ